ncbi:MAG: tetratricopeptide repeat protein [Phycisphaerae bacterium]
MRQTTLTLALVTLALAAAGCASFLTGESSGPSYRTIRTQPGRSTDLARKANAQGLDHLEVGELDQATRAFQKALTADVEFGPAHNNLGKVYYRQEDWYRAAWEFEYATKLLPRSAEPRNNLGLVLERAGELDRAVDCYREAVGLAPHRVEYRGNLVRALYRRGDRTSEVRTLLGEVLEEDTRIAWRAWAERVLATMDDG